MQTRMSDEEYWERSFFAALTGLCANSDCSNQWMQTPDIAAHVANVAVNERKQRESIQHGKQED